MKHGQPTSKRPTDKSVRVLIVEDDPFVAIDLEDTFLEAGFKVVGTCATAEQAVEAARTTDPDIATLDYQLVTQTSRRVAELLTRMDVPFVMVTSSRDEAKRHAVFEDKPCITKPFDARRLIDTARDIADA